MWSDLPKIYLTCFRCGTWDNTFGASSDTLSEHEVCMEMCRFVQDNILRVHLIIAFIYSLPGHTILIIP